MRLRSLSVALLAGVLLVPVGASSAVAVTSDTVLSATTPTYKSSADKRAKRAAYLAGRTTTTVTAPVKAPVTSVTTPTPTASYAERVLAATNRERTSRGLRALSFSACADGYADAWARSLSIAGSLSHQPLSPILLSCRARSVGENVAYGNVSAEEMVRMWMSSAGHRANLLNPGFTHIGIGDVTTSTGRVYGVQVFLTL